MVTKSPVSPATHALATHTGKEQRHIPWWMRPSNVIIIAFLWVATIYFLVPLYWLMVSSTKNTGDLFSTYGLWFAQALSLGPNLYHLFTYDDAMFGRWLINTFFYALVSAGFGLLFSTMMGYALAKYHFRGRNVIFGIILGSVLVPPTALALPLYLLLQAVGLTNTYWAVLLPSIANPFGVYLARIYAQAAVPDEVIDAARVDGAREWTIFRVMALPAMGPALVTIFLFQFVAVWNNFFLPLVMLSSQQLYPVTLGLFQWQSSASYGGAPPFLYSNIVTGSLISIIPLVISFVLLQRYWRGGFALGAVK